MTEEIEDLSLFTNLPPGFALHLLGRHAGLPLQQRGRVYISITTNDCEQKTSGNCRWLKVCHYGYQIFFT